MDDHIFGQGVQDTDVMYQTLTYLSAKSGVCFGVIPSPQIPVCPQVVG